MIFKSQSKNKKALLLVAVAILVMGVFLYFYSPVIFQEGNPWPQVKGIFQLTFGRLEMVKLSGADNKYMTRSQNDKDVLIAFLNDQGYRFNEQMGAGYFFENHDGNRLIATRRQYSRFYSIWSFTESGNIKDMVKWLDYKNDEYGFTFSYPSLSVDNQLWGNLSETLSLSDILLPNQVLSKGNNFYLHQQYSLKQDQQTGKVSKTENVFVPEYDGSYKYPLAWHIVILDVDNETGLDKVIKQKLGASCSYKDKIQTEFNGNYRVEIEGDGKDLGSTLCPVNYQNYIIYSPGREKVAFWSTGQECQIGLGFMAENCFDQKISDSFHFINQ